MENSKQDSYLRDGARVSPWQGTAELSRDKLISIAINQGQVYDCLVVGAGITGITTALFLQRAGLACVIAG